MYVFGLFEMQQWCGLIGIVLRKIYLTNAVFLFWSLNEEYPYAVCFYS